MMTNNDNNDVQRSRLRRSQNGPKIVTKWSQNGPNNNNNNSLVYDDPKGEQSDALRILLLNDSKSRHRRIKKQRRYERLAATSQLSLW
ncbi:hypothetical protein O5D80_001870 [Batrachochytrium dendrobatidis]|nr:hypothetical protein O5D80_001870 [Batrachochytrium dendrobatidis]